MKKLIISVITLISIIPQYAFSQKYRVVTADYLVEVDVLSFSKTDSAFFKVAFINSSSKVNYISNSISISQSVNSKDLEVHIGDVYPNDRDSSYLMTRVVPGGRIEAILSVEKKRVYSDASLLFVGQYIFDPPGVNAIYYNKKEFSDWRDYRYIYFSLMTNCLK